MKCVATLAPKIEGEPGAPDGDEQGDQNEAGVHHQLPLQVPQVAAPQEVPGVPHGQNAPQLVHLECI